MTHNPLLPFLSPLGQKHYANASVKEMIESYTLNTKTLTPHDQDKLRAIKESIELYTRTPDEIGEMSSSEMAKQFFAPLLQNKDREEVVIALLNTKNKIIHYETVFTGSLNHCIVHPREIMRIVVSHPTARFMIAHNHPSGDPTPSDQDLHSTRRLEKIGDLFGIDLLDHIVIGSNGNHVSIKEYISY